MPSQTMTEWACWNCKKGNGNDTKYKVTLYIRSILRSLEYQVWHTSQRLIDNCQSLYQLKTKNGLAKVLKERGKIIILKYSMIKYSSVLNRLITWISWCLSFIRSLLTYLHLKIIHEIFNGFRFKRKVSIFCNLFTKVHSF